MDHTDKYTRQRPHCVLVEAGKTTTVHSLHVTFSCHAFQIQNDQNQTTALLAKETVFFGGRAPKNTTDTL